MKRIIIFSLFLVGCASDNNKIDHRSYQLGCILGSLHYKRPLFQEDIPDIKDFCITKEEQTRKGVGE